MIIDAHAHIFPEKIASKASVNIGKFYDLDMAFDGTAQKLIEICDRAGVDKCIVQSVATVAEQVESINSFIALQTELHPDRFIGFATIHPDYPNISAEVERAIKLGLKGVKIHPDFQRFCIDDERAFAIYEAIEGRLPILVHTGDYRYEFSKPERMARVMDRFPKLDVISAHLGGWSEWESAQNWLAGRRVWVDTSSSLYGLSPEKATEIIKSFGVDNVLFGTDYPMWSAEEEIERVKKLGLTADELEKIFHKNVEKLLGL